MTWYNKWFSNEEILEENPKIVKAFDSIKNKAEEREDDSLEKMGISEYDMCLSQEYYYQNIYGNSADKTKLLKEYREMAMFPEVADAIDEICDEAISSDDNGEFLFLQLDNDALSRNNNKSKNLQKEFNYILNNLLDFNNQGFSLFRKFYIEGELFSEMVINKSSPKQGIKKLVFLPPETITPIYDEYNNITNFVQKAEGTKTDSVIKFSSKQVAYVNSGIFTNDKRIPLSHIERAKVAYRQLKWMEDALIIYRIVRAPERRVFTIDVGNLPKKKAEEHMNNIIRRYKQKKIYNPSTGEIDVGKQVLSMIEDYWLPQRGDGSGPKIDTLAGGTELGEIDDVLYFVKKLYKALKIPVKRLDVDSGGGSFQPSGREGEGDRDEIKFSKYVVRVRNRFSKFVSQIFFTQLKLKGLWKQYNLEEEMFKIIFNEENEWRETKKLENFRIKLDIFREAKEHTANPEKAVFSIEYLLKNIMKLSDEEITEINKGIDDEKKEAEAEANGENDGEEENDGVGFNKKKKSDDEPEKNPEKEPKDGEENEEPEDENDQLNS